MLAHEAEHLRASGTDLRVVLGQYMLIDIADRSVLDLRLEALKVLYKTTDKDDPIRERIFEIAQTIDELAQGEEYYEIIGACGYLDENNRCTSYDDRLGICREFPAGGVACMNFRDRVGIDDSAPQVIPMPIPTRKVSAQQ